MTLNKQLKIIICFTLFVSLIFVLYKFFNSTTEKRSQNKKNQNSTEQLLHNPEAIFKNFQLKQIGQDPKNLWVLKAEEGRLFHSSGKVECNNIECRLTNDNKQIAVLNSVKGFVDQNKKNVFLQGPVHGNFNGMQFEGKDINYNFSTHKLFTNSKMTYKHPFFQLCANKSLANLKTNKIEMTGGIQSNFFLKQKAVGYSGEGE